MIFIKKFKIKEEFNDLDKLFKPYIKEFLEFNLTCNPEAYYIGSIATELNSKNYEKLTYIPEIDISSNKYRNFVIFFFTKGFGKFFFSNQNKDYIVNENEFIIFPTSFMYPFSLNFKDAKFFRIDYFIDENYLE
jgi:hypothetical protein